MPILPARDKTMQTSTPARKKRGKLRSSDTVWGVLFVIPALLLAVPFKIYPLLRGLYDSTLMWEGTTLVGFVGLANYERMLHDEKLLGSFLNAFKIVLTLPIWVLLPMVLAFLIFQRTPGWSFFRATYFLPYTISPFIVGMIFREILQQSGPVNAFLKSIGLGFLAVAWLGKSSTALWVLDAVVLWSLTGLGVITYLAGFATISEEILEAATLDGAGFWSKFFLIILPLMRPVMGYWAILCTGGMFIWMFPFIHALTEGGPGFTTMLPEYLVYLTAFRFVERGYGTAIGVVLFFFVLTFSFLQVRHMYMAGTGEGGE
jgi:raffinose/stachyose/melibiose transport system permease protein